MSTEAASIEEPTSRLGLLSEMRTSEDWWAIWCGGILLAICFIAVWLAQPSDLGNEIAIDGSEKAVGQESGEKSVVELTSPLKPYLGKPAKWTSSPIAAYYSPETEGKPATDLNPATPAKAASTTIPGVLGVFGVIAILFAVAMRVRGKSANEFLSAFPFIFLLALLAYTMAAQSVVKAYNLEYALWALLVGLIISNTLGTPSWIRPAVLTEFYIKTGLVMLGAEVLMSRLLALGLPGIFVAWVVTPVVLVSTYAFGQKILKMKSASLNMVISADMSVCGVSAAIATAAACKAKKEELSLAIGLSLSFTVVMMIVLPAIIKLVGMDEILGGAWLGGTIDSTGAVAAAGGILGDKALEVAATVKMIQNILIGVTAFFVALYWVTYVERDPASPRPSVMELWYRFPKFVLGFVGMSIIFSVLYVTLEDGPLLIEAMIGDSSKTLRGWFFCLAFVCVGLDTNFRQLLPQLKGGKPLILYLCGQSLNLVLTLFMAWLMFKVVFADFVGAMLE